MGTVKPAVAAAASCAIPVLARPVRIGDHRYLDGGVKSVTHADVLVGADLDLVIVLSPMGHLAGRNPLRSVAHRQVRREIARLERVGLVAQLMGTTAQLDPSAAAVLRSASAAGATSRLCSASSPTRYEAQADATPHLDDCPLVISELICHGVRHASGLVGESTGPQRERSVMPDAASFIEFDPSESVLTVASRSSRKRT